MKKEDKRLIIIVASVFAIGIPIAAYVTIKATTKYQAQKRELVALKLNGILSGIKKQEKGKSIIIIVNRQTNDTLEFRLQIESFLEKEHIRVSDSISKEANNPILHFYKLMNNRYTECCEYEIIYTN